MGLEQLRLEARGGEGLEEFYGRLGWKEIGRWPGALRFDHGDRDEVLMLLAPYESHRHRGVVGARLPAQPGPATLVRGAA
jgi:hypothetical protein